jgi:hypothetical protein
MKILLGCVWFFSSFLLQAQWIQKGAVYSPERRQQALSFLQSNKGQVWLVRSDVEDDGLPTHVQVEVFDTLQWALQRRVDLPGVFRDRSAFYPESMYAFGDSLIFFGSAFDKASRSNLLKYRIYDLGQNRWLQEQADTLIDWTASYFTHNERRFIWAEDPSQQRLFIGQAQLSSDKSRLLLQYKVFDHGLHSLRSVQMQMPAEGDAFSIASLHFDAAHRVYLQVNWEQAPQHRRIPVVYALGLNVGEPVYLNFDIPQAEEQDIQMQLLPSGELLVAGLSGKTDPQANFLTRGCFAAVFNPEQAAIRVQKQWDFYALQDQIPGLQGRGMSWDEFSEPLKLLHLSASDTGISLWLEQQKQEEVCQTDFRSNMLICNTHYFRKAVLLLRLDTLLQWKTSDVLYKEQHLVEDEEVYLSFGLTDGGDGLLFNGSRSDSLRYSDPFRSEVLAWVPGTKALRHAEVEYPVYLKVAPAVLGRRRIYLAEGRASSMLVVVQ